MNRTREIAVWQCHETLSWNRSMERASSSKSSNEINEIVIDSLLMYIKLFVIDFIDEILFYNLILLKDVQVLLWKLCVTDKFYRRRRKAKWKMPLNFKKVSSLSIDLKKIFKLLDFFHLKIVLCIFNRLMKYLTRIFFEIYIFLVLDFFKLTSANKSH